MDFAKARNYLGGHRRMKVKAKARAVSRWNFIRAKRRNEERDAFVEDFQQWCEHVFESEEEDAPTSP